MELVRTVQTPSIDGPKSSRDRSHLDRPLLWLIAATGLVAFFASDAGAGQFQEVTSQVGLIQDVKKSWGNPVWGDFNNDGFIDLMVPCHGLNNSKGPFVYLNNLGHTLTDIRSTSGVEQAPEFDSTDWHGFSLGDYDGDGNLDLYIAEGAKAGEESKRDLLFRGNGDGTFSYASDVAGLDVSVERGRVGCWLDYDNDGKLDLFVKNSFGTNVLYKNSGNGTFTKIANAGGLDKATLGTDSGSTCSFADYNNDGYMDVLFTGDGEKGINDTDGLYKNMGNGKFVDVTAAAGITPYSYGHSIAWGDYNNDGLLDIYISRIGSRDENAIGRLYRQNSNGTFTDVTAAAGVASLADDYGAAWGDYDNDGYLDLIVSNAGLRDVGTGNNNFLYHNNGDGTFTDVAAAQGVALQDNNTAHKGVAWADYDNDGFLDLIVKDGVGGETDSEGVALGVHRLFHNTGNSNHYLEIALSGVQSNRRGIGARVKATYDGKLSFRENNGGGGGENASQGSGPIHIGIGTAATATVEIDWPSGVVDILPSVAANSSIKVVEGSGMSSLPVILNQPRNAKVNVGQTARFRVKASSETKITYQWQKNGANISGATKPTYVTPPVTQTDNGSKFDVIVSNNDGSVTSHAATLTVR